MSTQLSHPPDQATSRHTAPWLSALAVPACAVAAAVAVRLIAYAAGIDVVVETSGDRDTVTLAPVIVGSAVGAMSGVLVLQLALRFFDRGRRWWTIGAIVCLIGSLTSPLAATTASGWAVLSLMHLVVGAGVILGLRRISTGRVA